MKDAHTEHCCLVHGCKYGEDDYCTVVQRIDKQSYNPCSLTDECVKCFCDDKCLEDFTLTFKTPDVLDRLTPEQKEFARKYMTYSECISIKFSPSTGKVTVI